MMTDQLVENSRKSRDLLLKELGGMKGLCDKLEAMDRARSQKRSRKQQLRKSKKTAK